MKKIVIAGGCFWGVEEYYRRLKGIDSTKVGYVNGSKDNITYDQVCQQVYGAIEAVELFYDENLITLSRILDHLFRIIDPTSLDKQGNDVGVSYRVGAYFENDIDKKIIEDYISSQKDNFENTIVFENKKVERFCEGEKFHQMYLANNPKGYCHIDFNKIREEELK